MNGRTELVNEPIILEIAARRRREDLELARENTSKDISTIRNKSKGIPLWISEK
ncbi:hypothetical protein WUBG_12015 [Wuchereria bancrofti]|uniref:Uncharacterized protein n=1 Tax=Wuchereria bancrofti TaxID=6293 RepID=J9EJA3_WUCBA|nr:hypothetical protein WUBG_12015 [Wuchereria bancrofti]